MLYKEIKKDDYTKHGRYELHHVRTINRKQKRKTWINKGVKNDFTRKNQNTLH